MNAAGRLITFAGLVAALSGGAAVAGGAIDPPQRSSESAGHAAMPEDEGPHAVPGLAVADDDGYRLELANREHPLGKAAPLAFRITRDGEPLTDFTVSHEKKMHLILARRDGRGFQHLHPTMSPEGTWSTPVAIGDAGAYRVFADFETGKEDKHTLGADLAVDGPADYQPLPEPAAVADAGDGLTVELEGESPEAGQEAEIEFTVFKNGRPTKTATYLGAGGHLVALREGDLGFLHTHPAEEGEAGGDAVHFGTEFPSTGRYRLYFQFQLDGRVHTAEFTQEVVR
jgi:hypothetical protein